VIDKARVKRSSLGVTNPRCAGQNGKELCFRK
jgi:hypothetical protein